MVFGQRNVPKLTCPLCSQEQDVIVNGHYFTEDTMTSVIDDTLGFAFCNCKNIFFNDWKNIEQGVYNEDYTKKYANPVTSNYFKKYHKNYAPIIREHKVSGKFLELGCVNATVLDCFKADGYKTASFDIIPHVWEGHENIVGDFEAYVSRETFSVIWASHVFEHFKKPINALISARNMLDDGGLIFIAMPDPYFIDWKSPYSWGHWHLKEHFIMWDMDSFCQTLENIGFEVIMKHHNVTMEHICNADFHIIVKKV